jgi:ribonuclease HI
VQPGGRWESGFDPSTTNQRMELCAALAACEAFAGALTVVSDSTYVVHCWRDRWWEGWLRRGWRNSKKEPVANQDLWERLVPHFRDRADLSLEWVKGHSGDRWNDVADRLAVAAVIRRAGAAGQAPPTEVDLGPEDLPDGPAAAPAATPAAGRSDAARARDGRVPPGYLVVVTGQAEGFDRGAARDDLTGVLAGMGELHPGLVVVTGLRRGAEEVAADAAAEAGVPTAIVLPYDDPARGWPAAERARFDAALAEAAEVVVLEGRRPSDAAGRTAALARRDGWLRSVADAAVVLTDGSDTGAEDALRRFEQVLAEDVWRLDVQPG